MSPKDFRKISHPEPELSTNKVSGDGRTDGRRTQPLLELTPQGGQLKTAETLALETALDDSLYISNFLSEIYYGPESTLRIPLYIYDDSKSLIQSLFSTKKVKRKTMRVVISRIQQLLKNKTIVDAVHVKTKDQVADILTKHGVSNQKMIQILNEGRISFS